MAKRYDRTLGRRAALQVLYESDILGTPVDKVVDEGVVPEEAALNDYARRLLLGVASHITDIDRQISKSSKNWAIDRMPLVDRALLRITVFEMQHVDEVPVAVSINEAVELAKDFGGDDTYRFVNGILGRIARTMGEDVPESDEIDDMEDEPQAEKTAEPEVQTEPETEVEPEAENAEADSSEE
ncbi:N utilization substance protein B homolog [Slackia heliotrinireducens]|jgi:N utilization substance protein B|uniref:Transcription antitermination protein NusB n=1 Tax=Slackia heliotrinireducens (strain ATCC 29202 / DSM 20476 / NCTC 11029 / RHS 1) TaxID=471855 RepID=C7N4M1_SLAHD|nr:transcription antitermination factor NusB [Slackia heliotrinireducens]ACV21856.1 transcription antitermination factor NusB [Slackia heliotrinireducens DSM 20476]VEG99609.1 N utilization substance protein B homolog [Slackia heliotrinireducens]